MISKILVRGMVLKVFIVLLWVAVTLSYFVWDKVLIVEFTVILLFIINLFLYFSVALNLLLLTKSYAAKITPGYFAQIKKSLVIIFLVSILPTLVLLSHFTLWLSLFCALLLMAMLVVAMMYHPTFYWLFILICFVAPSVESLNTVFDLPDFTTILAFLLPLVIFVAFKLLNKLETYRGTNDKITGFSWGSSFFNTNDNVLTQEKRLRKSHSKFTRWISERNFTHYLSLIRSGKKISNRELLEIACQSSGSVGRFTYFLWTLMWVTFYVVNLFLKDGSQVILIPIFVVFPAMLVSAGTMMLFQVVNIKKSYLARLSIMPCFIDNNNRKQNSFARSFLGFIIKEQLTLYSFILIGISVLVSVYHYITIDMYINVLLAVVSIGLINLTLMLLAWGSKQRLNHLVLWIMATCLIGMIVFLMLVADNGIVLLNSALFIGLMVLVAGLFVFSLRRCYRFIPHW